MRFFFYIFCRFFESRRNIIITWWFWFWITIQIRQNFFLKSFSNRFVTKSYRSILFIPLSHNIFEILSNIIRYMFYLLTIPIISTFIKNDGSFSPWKRLLLFTVKIFDDCWKNVAKSSLSVFFLLFHEFKIYKN